MAVVEDTLGRTVLLVEDDAGTRNMVTRHLRNSGYEVVSVESAEEVMLIAAQRPEPFDVVISDVHLPGMSGIDLASHLLKARPTQAIVLVTGDPDEALARDALSRGPVSYLLKPFELFELDAAVRQALARTAKPAPVVERPVAPETPPAFDGQIPAEWLEFIDERSYAGPGHADRVARIAVTLTSCLPDVALELTAADLALAARTHEIGRLDGPTADPSEMAVQGATLLREAGFPEVVVRTVRHLHERWDGTGGPERLSGSRIPAGSLVLSAADSLDHYCSAWMQAGMKPADAVDRAIGLVIVQQSTLFSPLVAGAVHKERSAIRAICTAERPQEDLTAQLASLEPHGHPVLRMA